MLSLPWRNDLIKGEVLRKTRIGSQCISSWEKVFCLQLEYGINEADLTLHGGIPECHRTEIVEINNGAYLNIFQRSIGKVAMHCERCC